MTSTLQKQRRFISRKLRNSPTVTAFFFMIVTDVKLSRLRPTGKTKELLSLHLKMDLKSERASILESVLGSQTETKT